MSSHSTDSYSDSKHLTFQENDEPQASRDQYQDYSDKVIDAEPEPQSPIGEDGRPSMQTVSETWSGYHRDTNECTEFCQDCCICFGACDACCPSTGEGCLSSTAAFFGNIMVGFCKC
ncbi:hypothetical protein FT663_01690 [Candidozyma haemuli var. vulneris]|nr:hypothetical protein FT662_02176 [[Candida] haemuloni var. vulneris]KAF3993980.1 hypothetical protein FT663_01690 [[Candida] haemuloni var. vulneris]